MFRYMRKSILLMSVVALLAAVMLGSCTKYFYIEVLSDNNLLGHVAGGGSFAKGAEVTITAIPADGYFFSHWNDGDTTNPRTLSVRHDATFTAFFTDTPTEEIDGPIVLPSIIISHRVLSPRGYEIDYLIDGTTTIAAGVNVVVEPGTTISFTRSDGTILVRGSLKMIGTPENHITIRALHQDYYNIWNTIYYISHSKENQMEYVDVIDGGYTDSPITVSGKLSMRHCTIQGSDHNGINLISLDGLRAFEDNTVRQCSGVPIYTNYFTNINGLGNGNKYIDNRLNVIYLDDYVAITDLRFSKQEIPYRLVNGLRTEAGVNIGFEAGSVIEVGGSRDIYIYDHARLQVSGTQQDPVIFRGVNLRKWNGIVCYSKLDSNYIQHCTIRDIDVEEVYKSINALRVGTGTRMTLSNMDIRSAGVGLALFIPHTFDSTANRYIYHWDSLGVTANNISYQCGITNVYDVPTKAFFTGDQIPSN